MIIDSDLIEKAKAFAKSVDRDEVSGDLSSAIASFEHRLANGSDRAAFAHARAVVRLAEREGHTVGDTKPATVADLRAEVARRNEGRAEADLIRPAGAKKADLEQALADDDAKG